MKKFLLSLAVMAGLMAVSCSQDEQMVSLPDAVNSQIGYAVTADNGSRSMTAYENGTDVDKITVSAWINANKDVLPGYGSTNTGNAVYFTNDVLTRNKDKDNGKKGTFNYATDARYWPQNDEYLDFFAVVDEDLLNTNFSFSGTTGKPGLDATITQNTKAHEMPDLLFATVFDQQWNKNRSGKYQQNVSFKFDHAFAKVIVTAEVKNKNLRVEITDMKIRGVHREGKFDLPYKSGVGPVIVTNPASWKIDQDGPYTSLKCPSTRYSRLNPLVVEKGEKAALVEDTKEEAMLVLPYDYNGRNTSKPQTYIELTAYAYNISGDSFDEDTDQLIYGKYNDNGDPVPYKMCIPIEFNWEMGTCNHYNIIFDCGNGGVTPDNPEPDPEDPENPDDPDEPTYPDNNQPAFIRIGYEVEVTDWTDGENKEVEYKDGKVVDATMIPIVTPEEGTEEGGDDNDEDNTENGEGNDNE